jgi:hypothetical protein
MDPLQNQNPVPATEGKKSFGPIAGVIIIVILLIIGAVVMLGGDDAAQDEAANTSDEVSAIESDLSAEGETEIDLSELDSI